MKRIIVLTHEGEHLAKRIVTYWSDCEIHVNPKPFAQVVHRFFESGDALIFICATGIVVRTLAPVLKDKKSDPPVLVLDEQGQFVVPLISGHEGGANALAHQLAQAMGAQAVITSASRYIDPVYTVGMGCERNCSVEDLRQLFDHCLQTVGLSPANIESLASIDVKSDEKGLIALADQLQVPFLTWPARTLNCVVDQLSTRSQYVFDVVGVYGVAESAALVAAEQATHSEAELVLTKQKNAKATCAIARSYRR